MNDDVFYTDWTFVAIGQMGVADGDLITVKDKTVLLTPAGDLAFFDRDERLYLAVASGKWEQLFRDDTAIDQNGTS
jgi:hypothetical protein